MPENAFDYVIVGAGALGSLVAAHLVSNGLAVVLVEDDEKRRTEVESSGVRVVGFKDVPARRPAVASPAEVAHLSLSEGAAVVVAVSPSDAAPTLDHLQSALPPETPLLSMIGGLEVLDGTAAWPGEVVLGVVNLEARLDAAGDVEASFHNFIWLGNLDATLTPAMKRMQRDLACVGPTLTTKAIRGMHWGKALYALESSLPAIVEIHPTAFFAQEANRDIAVAIVREGIRIAEASDVTPIAFDFFDPNLYRASNAGERAALHAWLEHAWQRHERFRFGAAHEFPAICGLCWAMSPRNPRSELKGLIRDLQTRARTSGVDTPALAALEEVAHRASGGAEMVPADLQGAFGEVAYP